MGVYGSKILAGGTLNSEDRILKVMDSLSYIISCMQCGTRLRFGDTECPHCGGDLENILRYWAEQLLERLDARTD